MNRTIVIVTSIIVPLLVAVLYFTTKSESVSEWLYSLPMFNASFNGATTIVLLTAVFFIKKGNVARHRQFMKLAFILGACFLVSYILYHALVPSTVFGDLNGDGQLQHSELEAIGIMRNVYLGILLSHIIMAIVALPLILFAFFYGLKDNRVQHKRIVRFAFPIWLYVSITGVVVYFLISPYY